MTDFIQLCTIDLDKTIENLEDTAATIHNTKFFNEYSLYTIRKSINTLSSILEELDRTFYGMTPAQLEREEELDNWDDCADEF